ncbi:hypothetical protein LCGC14_1682220 [marine sediment metagenome]|uniref:Uncharacterized protein n=1 Tax=marine sediment metagenome TaxID=412755 RepID=A0A0F9HNP8_9ZZZZ
MLMVRTTEDVAKEKAVKDQDKRITELEQRIDSQDKLITQLQQAVKQLQQVSDCDLPPDTKWRWVLFDEEP